MPETIAVMITIKRSANFLQRRCGIVSDHGEPGLFSTAHGRLAMGRLRRHSARPRRRRSIRRPATALRSQIALPRPSRSIFSLPREGADIGISRAFPFVDSLTTLFSVAVDMLLIIIGAILVTAILFYGWIDYRRRIPISHLGTAMVKSRLYQSKPAERPRSR